MRRPRGPGGRFLTADEVSAIEKGEGGELQKYAANLHKPDSRSPTTETKTPQAGTKRKSGPDQDDDTPAKRARVNSKKTSSASEDDDDEEDDDADEDES